MIRFLIFSIWCSISVFSKTEIYFKAPESELAEWLEEAHFPPLRIYFYENEGD